jgi:chemotaxis protein methyltransferase CheR
MTTQLSDADFVAVRDYLVRTAGLVFDENRRAGLAIVVADRLADSGARSVADYLARLVGDEGYVERMRLLDGVTVQETHFFRNTPQMDALRQRVLPDLMRPGARGRSPSGALVVRRARRRTPLPC